MSDNMETMDGVNVYTPPPGYGQPPGEPKKSNTPMIIGIIVLILLCCCITFAVLVGGWFFGDQIIEMLGIQVMRVVPLV